MIHSLDHLVITITDAVATRRFCEEGLGIRWTTFDADGETREALTFGRQKINIHHKGREFEPKAALPTLGSVDLCLLTEADLDEVVARMAELGFAVLEGPVPRSGATAPILSLYFRDPDGNLIEVAKPR